jgi:hypothetical protein
LREHALLQNCRGAPRPPGAGSSVPHPGCLQCRGVFAPDGGTWSVMPFTPVMAGAFLSFFPHGKKRK